MLLRVLPDPYRDVAILVGRVLLGVVLIAHGASKVFVLGLSAVTANFTKMGVWAAPVSAGYASVVELVGGALLILGAATTVVSVLVVPDMLGAAMFTGRFFAVIHESNGWELEGMISTVAVLLLAVGAGRLSVDHLLLRRSDRRSDQRSTTIVISPRRDNLDVHYAHGNPKEAGNHHRRISALHEIRLWTDVCGDGGNQVIHPVLSIRHDE